MRKKELLTLTDIEQIILMAWGDTISFETIYREYGLTENQVVAFMRKYQSPKTYTRWRVRLAKRTKVQSKHEALTTISSRRQKFPI